MRLALIFSLSSKDRLQPFKLQSNYQPSKREMFIFLSLKPMFADCTISWYLFKSAKFKVQLRAVKLRNTFQNLRLLVSKLDQDSEMSDLGLDGIHL